MRHACRRMDAAASTRMSRPFVCRPCVPVISAGTDAADPITTGNYPASPCHAGQPPCISVPQPGNRPASPCHGRATALRLRATTGNMPWVFVPRPETGFVSPTPAPVWERLTPPGFSPQPHAFQSCGCVPTKSRRWRPWPGSGCINTRQYRCCTVSC